MRKVFLLLALGLVTALYFPESRAKIWNFVRPVTYPFLGWQTRGELKQVAKDLVRYEQDYYQFPAAREFSEWLAERYDRDPALRSDAWGTPYILQSGGRNIWFVISAGPDEQFGTDDDLQAEVERPNLRRR